MKISLVSALYVVGSVFFVYSAQDSAIFAKKAELMARQKALIKASANQSTNAASSSQSAAPVATPSIPLRKIDTSASHTVSSSPETLPKASSSVSKDSTALPTATPEKNASPAKTVSTEKNSAIDVEDMLIDETEEKKHPAKDMRVKNQELAPVSNDTLGAAQKAVAFPDSQNNAAQSDDQKSASENASTLTDTTAAKNALQQEKPMAPAAIESIHSINFAKNQKDYRSPKLAMLLSLVVPGLGQAYVKQYVKTGIFVALEATAIGFSVAFNNKGKKQYADATTFADNNYNDNSNVTQYTMTKYYSDLYNLFLSQQPQGMNADSARQSAREKLTGIFVDTSFVHSASKWSSFYNDIQNNSFVQGWKDGEPPGNKIIDWNSDTISVGQNRYLRDSTGYLVYKVDKNGKIDSTKALYGYSSSQIHYNDMVSKSNSYYKTAQGILFTMLFNHIISAVDALISAKAYNDALLGKESFWQHLFIEQQLVDAGPSPSAGITMRIQF
jgi:hypothetical protein